MLSILVIFRWSIHQKSVFLYCWFWQCRLPSSRHNWHAKSPGLGKQACYLASSQVEKCHFSLRSIAEVRSDFLFGQSRFLFQSCVTLFSCQGLLEISGLLELICLSSQQIESGITPVLGEDSCTNTTYRLFRLTCVTWFWNFFDYFIFIIRVTILFFFWQRPHQAGLVCMFYVGSKIKTLTKK